MKTERIPLRVVAALVFTTGLLVLGLGLLSRSRSSTAATFPFYSPIPPVGNPQLGLSKTIDDVSPKVGDEVVYTLSYANTNSGSQAFNVRLYEFLPAGFTFLSSNPTADLAQNRMLLFTAPSVGPGTESVEITVRGRVQAGYEQLHNQALVLADGVTPTYAELRTDVTQPLSSLRLVKTGYTTVLVNDLLVYTLMCQNNGDMMAREVTLVDVLPNGLPLVDADPPPDEVTLPTVKWSLGNLAPGARRTIVITTTAPSSAGVIANTALADARQMIVTSKVFGTQVVNQAAILRATKHGSAPLVRPEEVLTYTIAYENGGNQIATGVRLTDTLPAGIEVIAVDPPASSLTAERGLWMLGTLNPGDDGQIIIRTIVRGQAGTTLLNKVDISAQPGSFPGHTELETDISFYWLYLPMEMRNWQ